MTFHEAVKESVDSAVQEPARAIAESPARTISLSPNKQNSPARLVRRLCGLDILLQLVAPCISRLAKSLGHVVL